MGTSQQVTVTFLQTAAPPDTLCSLKLVEQAAPTSLPSPTTWHPPSAGAAPAATGSAVFTPGTPAPLSGRGIDGSPPTPKPKLVIPAKPRMSATYYTSAVEERFPVQSAQALHVVAARPDVGKQHQAAGE